MFAAFSFPSAAGPSRKLKVCAISFVSDYSALGGDICFMLKIAAKFVNFRGARAVFDRALGNCVDICFERYPSSVLEFSHFLCV